MHRMLSYAQIAAGTLIMALAVNLFLVPNELPAGGASGLMLILHYLWNVPIGLSYLLINVPALFLLWRTSGFSGVIKTVWGTVCFSFFVDATASLAAQPLTENLLLASVYAGTGIGLGIGLALRAGGSTGGSDAIAKVVRHYTGLEVGKFILYSDIAILAFGAVMLSPEAILYALIITFVITRMIQVVQEGLTSSRCLLVITQRPDEVAGALMREAKRGITWLEGTGGYTGHRRPVLMCVVSEQEVLKAKRAILQADPEAFLVITDAREVAGRGFTLDTDIRRVSVWASGD